MAKKLTRILQTQVDLPQAASERSSFQSFVAQREKLLIFAIFLFAVIFRFLTVSDNTIYFLFDQARDATIVQEMITQRDLKIQGPSASGTNDMIYHGALYYYLIAPVYAVARGNPQLVSYFFALLSSIAVVPLFYLTKNLTQNRWAGILAAGLYAFSFEASQTGTWLSNPVMVMMTLPFFYWFFWRIFFQNRTQELPWLMLFLGLTNQAVIFSGYLWLIILLGYWIASRRNTTQRFTFPLRTLILSAVVYLATVSTLVLNHLLLLRNGVLRPLEFIGTLSKSGTTGLIEQLSQTFHIYARHINMVYFPQLGLFSLLLFGVIVWTVKKTSSQPVRYFLSLWFFAPLLLLSFLFRNNYHSSIGLSFVLYILLAVLIVQASKDRVGKVFAVILVIGFLSANISQLIYAKQESFHIASIQSRGLLKHQLDLLDDTYQKAAGQPFSISTLTVPYGYNTTWAYLYNWYGKSKYGYTPNFYGSSQSGSFGPSMLTIVESPDLLHFSIFEPLEGISQDLYKDFATKQVEAAGPILDERRYSTFQTHTHDRTSR